MTGTDIIIICIGALIFFAAYKWDGGSDIDLL